MKTHELVAQSDYETAGKQFIARLTGRDSRMTFAREFIGRRSGKRNDITSARVDQPGLYQVRDTSRKGIDDTFSILWRLDSEVVLTEITEEQAMGLAGKPIADIEAAGLAQEIIACAAQIATMEAKDPAELVTVKEGYLEGLSGLEPGPHPRSECIAARRAHLARLNAASVAMDAPAGDDLDVELARVVAKYGREAVLASLARGGK